MKTVGKSLKKIAHARRTEKEKEPTGYDIALGGEERLQQNCYESVVESERTCLRRVWGE